MQATLIIPTYNEEDTIQTLINAIKAAHPDLQIIISDDGSSDHGVDQIDATGVDIIHHPYNIGNGAAVKSGIRASKGDFLIFMDADGQHDSADIPALLESMDRYDMVVGERRSAQQASLARAIMNRLYNLLASYVTGFPIKDLTSGFRAVRADLARDILPLLPNGYSWPTTMTLVLLRSGFSVKYIPINAQPRKYGISRIRPVRDGFRFFMIIVKICTLYSPFRIFLPVSVGLFFLGVMNYAYTYLSVGRFTNMSALMFTAAVLVFMMGLISEQISQISLLRHQVRPARKNSDSSKKNDCTDGGEQD